MNHYDQSIYVDFIESREAQKKVMSMALHLFRKNYPRDKPIVYETDLRDAMCYVVNTHNFRQTQNLHNLRIDAAKRLFHTIVENRYAEDELFDEYVNVQKRVHETSQAQSVASCKNKLKDRCYYSTGTLI